MRSRMEIHFEFCAVFFMRACESNLHIARTSNIVDIATDDVTQDGRWTQFIRGGRTVAFDMLVSVLEGVIIRRSKMEFGTILARMFLAGDDGRRLRGVG